VVENIVSHHHERWDDAGYPNRLADDAIPLEHASSPSATPSSDDRIRALPGSMTAQTAYRRVLRPPGAVRSDVVSLLREELLRSRPPLASIPPSP
jgi:hypothetical protein